MTISCVVSLFLLLCCVPVDDVLHCAFRNGLLVMFSLKLSIHATYHSRKLWTMHLPWNASNWHLQFRFCCLFAHVVRNVSSFNRENLPLFLFNSSTLFANANQFSIMPLRLLRSLLHDNCPSRIGCYESRDIHQSFVSV